MAKAKGGGGREISENRAIVAGAANRTAAREMGGQERFVVTLGRLGIKNIRAIGDVITGRLNKGPVYRIRYNRRDLFWTADGRTGGLVIHQQGMRELSRWIRRL